MLSYQHIYHAGNLADVHKHALLAWMLDYLTRKDKPLSYIETHAGRGLYRLDATEALKTGEAAQGIERATDEGWFAATHPYSRLLSQVTGLYGDTAYPGSPMLAALALRPGDKMNLAELHPRERAALEAAMGPYGAHIHARDGFAMALAVVPPTPRRGLMLIDPSYEVKTDYDTIPGFIDKVTRKWNVGIVALWYPILGSGAHEPMLRTLQQAHPEALRHEVAFVPAGDGHGMSGSGMFVVNPPFGLEAEAAAIGCVFDHA